MDDHLDVLVSIAQDLTAAPSAGDRYQRLLASLNRVIDYDAAALLRLEDGVLVPVAARGLAPSALARRYPRREHPRLDVVCGSQAPVFFPADSKLPDPFDGLLLGDPEATHRVHACLGCPLLIHGELLGVLTADARAPDAFAAIDPRCLTAVAALAAAELRTTELIEALEHSAERQGLIARDLMREAAGLQAGHIIGSSPVMIRLRQELELVARSDFTVLITGETGVGKELVARAIHAASARRAQPLIHVNCAALPETLAESELFGHVRGAFTGATADRPGKFEVADGGTLFLDEIGEVTPGLQVRLLRVLQERQYEPLGSTRSEEADVRVIAASNRDLAALVERGAFRQDLYYRVKVMKLELPPLRRRPEDVPLLVQHFIGLFNAVQNKQVSGISADALGVLVAHDFPGNVRELQNAIEHAFVLLAEGQIELEHLPAELVPISVPHGESRRFVETRRAMEVRAIREAIRRNGGSRLAAAQELGMHKSTLFRKVRQLGIDLPEQDGRSKPH